MSNDEFKNTILKWISEFKSKLNGSNHHDSFEYYILNKEFLSSPKERGNLNRKIYNQGTIDYKNGRFYLLEKELWNSIKSKYPNEKEIKYKGAFINNKYVFEINKHVYYFYFINENSKIEEGYFEFTSHPHSGIILPIFYDLKINEFLSKMKSSEKPKYVYEGINFIFKIKERGAYKNKKNIEKEAGINNNDKHNNNHNNDRNNKFCNNINDHKIKFINKNDFDVHERKNKKLSSKDKDNNINLNNKKNIPFNPEKNDKKDLIIDKNIHMQNKNINIPINKNYKKKNSSNEIIYNNININEKNNFESNKKNNYNKENNNIDNKNINIIDYNFNNNPNKINNYNNNINNFNNINNYNNNNPKYNKINKDNKDKFHHRSKSAGSRFIIPKIPYLFHANGLENVGATCYMNATLQCLAHVENLTKGILKPETMQKILSDKSKYKLSNSYLEVINNLWQNNTIKYHSPNNFKNIISEMNPLFAGIQANDSKDLVLFLMETMHNELNTAKKISPQNQNINQYDYEQTFKLFTIFFKNNYNSIISNLFYGMYNSMMTCFFCKKKTHNVQCYNILIFPLEEIRKFKKRNENLVYIKECFEYYEKEDKMIGENQIFCNSCHKMSNSINQSRMIIGPNVLVINLNRGKGLQFDIKINFGEYLDLKKFIYYKKSPYYYEIIGIVTHFGPSSMGGHFIAFCKSFVDQKWYKYNDAIVTNSSFQEASSTGVPYILFYSYIQK